MRFSCLLAKDGRVRCWGDNALGQLGAPARGSGANCFGEAHQDEVEFPGRCSPEPGLVEGLHEVKQLALGTDHACALRADGTVWCWGSNWQGELGVGAGPHAGVAVCRDDTECARAPVLVPGLRARTIAAGGAVTCAVRDDGRLVCWGDATFGQIQDASNKCTVTDLPCARSPVPIEGVTDVVQVAIGGWQLCALRATGQLLCWGGNEFGEAGSAREDNETCQRQVGCVRSPKVVAGLAARQVVAGYFHTCALEDDGRVACWGRDDSGDLGSGTADETCGKELLPRSVPCSSRPRLVEGLPRAARLAAGGSCAIGDAGELFCWGANEFGQLGSEERGSCRRNGEYDLPCARSAVAVSVAGRTIDAAAVGGHVCVARDDGRVLCWGANGSAESGPLSPDDALCIIIPPDQKEPCVRRPRELARLDL
jgi:alpha-tubulin suppressor-like RCC1 family protein